MSTARRSGCGPVTVIIIIGALLAVLLAGADRLADHFTEREVASQLRNELGMASDPSVEIQGIPFLTQVAANRFGSVDVSGTGVRLSDGVQQLALRSVRLHLTDVVTADRFQTITATGLEGDTVIDWFETSRLTTLAMSHGGGDRVNLDVSQRVYGQTISIIISGVPTIDPARQTLALTQPRAELGGRRVPDNIVRVVMDEVLRPVPLTLPLGLRATGATATPHGLQIGLRGRDVPLVR